MEEKEKNYEFKVICRPSHFRPHANTHTHKHTHLSY